MSELVVNGLRVWFPGAQHQKNSVVRDVTLEAKAGTTIGIVGESGSGKSMTALAILGMVPFPGKVSGSIKYKNKELLGLPGEELEKIRGKEISIVFQDPSSSLDPVFTIEQQLTETIIVHQSVKLEEAKKRALACLQMVDIPSPESRLKDYPHQFSGGMKQRILIAMALACEPNVLILDEPTTALDVTVQAQLLDLVESIQKKNKMAIILISHDLGIVAEIADEIAIMYAGRIVEQCSVTQILNTPMHPYTVGLLNSIPKLGEHKQPLHAINGFPPNPSELPSGCPFHARCDYKSDKCLAQDPPYIKNKQGIACWHPVISHD